MRNVTLIEVDSLDNLSNWCEHELRRVNNSKVCMSCKNVYHLKKERQLYQYLLQQYNFNINNLRGNNK